MNIIEALETIRKDNNSKIRRRKYKLKEYKCQYGEFYVLNIRYAKFINDFLDKAITNYELLPSDTSKQVVNELKVIKDSVKSTFQNTWLKCNGFDIEDIIANDWEVVK